ncbi:LPS assembly protein LptD [Paracoccus sp. DMF-8]|uniref:LPS-assembly protein LptD n=1 Tax=Paracoccus sp. DMF-8 TaxID=3019445 RepID=UPI0023E868F6|nr:LPS assembly protein LptD [Paracoccus sp. DMF-8]MDF3605908.1 LPS assembly protein LptD [Paracoccus sp. DMF-8]
MTGRTIGRTKPCPVRPNPTKAACFSLDRFPGWDARESGLRANLGLTWTRLDPSGWSLALTAGRVLRSRVDPAFMGSSPLGGRRSDWLVSAQCSHPDGLAIANRALFDDSLHISRNDFRLGWLRPDLQLSAGYLWMDSDALENRDDDVSELTANADWQIANNWWGAAELRYDFSADRAQKELVGLEYRNECLTVDMSVKRRFSSSGDLKPETSLDLGIGSAASVLRKMVAERWRAIHACAKVAANKAAREVDAASYPGGGDCRDADRRPACAGAVRSVPAGCLCRRFRRHGIRHPATPAFPATA